MENLFSKKSDRRWKLRRIFIISLINFLVGFMVAWLIWSQTGAYMLALMQS